MVRPFAFFSSKVDAEEFERLISGETSKLTPASLQQHYIGFIVIKPLPETVVGRTCLRTYGMVDGRDFPNVRPYKINLFGIELSVKSLAFQEQDSVAAACASSALWTAFQGTGLLFQHDIPSPLAITRLAIERSPTASRAFPASDGLHELQMAEAVRGVGLDPLTLQTANNLLLSATCYAYLRSGIPIVWIGLVTATLPTVTQPQNQWLAALGQLPPGDNPGPPVNVFSLPGDGGVGRHAVTLVGYRLADSTAAKAHPLTGTLLRSSKIDKLYIHDDNIGAFARVEFEKLQLQLLENSRAVGLFDWFSCKWDNSTKGRAYISQEVLVPLFTTIRIPFHSILGAILWFDRTLEGLRGNKKANFANRFEWDIYLSSQNDYKTACFKDASMRHGLRTDVLTTALPRYVWLATAYDGTSKLFDFVFDSTDIEQGLKLVKIVPYDQAAYDELLHVADVYSTDTAYPTERLQPHGKIWEYIRELYEATKTQPVS
jgi:hypothetical protein